MRGSSRLPAPLPMLYRYRILFARANPAITGTFTSGSPTAGLPTSTAIRLTASRSSGDAAGNPASMISTPMRASERASSSFSAEVIVAPGDCSPSRKVVSKIRDVVIVCHKFSPFRIGNRRFETRLRWANLYCFQFSGLNDLTAAPACHISDSRMALKFFI